MEVGDLVIRIPKYSRFTECGRVGHYGVIYAIKKRDRVTGQPVTVSIFWDDGKNRKNYRARLLEVINGRED